MICKRSLTGFWVVLACLAWSGVARAAGEGVHVDPEIMKATSPLSSDQQASLDQTVSDAVDAAVKAPENEVAQACSVLRDPLNQGGSAIFKRAYLTALERKLAAVLAADPPVTPVARFNVMSVVADMIADDPSPAVMLPILHLGLHDSNAGGGATIYWAARAAASLADAAQLAAAEEKGLLADLVFASTTIEKTAPIGSAWPALEAVNQALTHLNDPAVAPAAAAQLLDGMERRLPLYIADPGLSVAPEREGLIALYVHKYTVVPPANEVVIRVAKVTFRYLDMAGKLCDLDPNSRFIPAPASAQPELRRYIEAASKVLPWAWDTLKVHRKMPVMPNPLPVSKDWIYVLVPIRHWGESLTAAPFSIRESELWAPVRQKGDKPTD
jgi:hypothetical protein